MPCKLHVPMHHMVMRGPWVHATVLNLVRPYTYGCVLYSSTTAVYRTRVHSNMLHNACGLVMLNFVIFACTVSLKNNIHE